MEGGWHGGVVVGMLIQEVAEPVAMEFALMVMERIMDVVVVVVVDG